MTVNRAALLDDFSIEVTARDGASLTEAAANLPAGTRVNITALGTEDPTARLALAASAHRDGLTPVLHLAARRVASEQELRSELGAIQDQGTSSHVVVVGGDPRKPVGPYDSALSVLRTDLLGEHGVREVGVSGYPEGHPDIDDATLARALTAKVALLEAQGLETTVITQFSFDVDAVLGWVERVRDLGVDSPLRIGVPGPTSVKRLLAFAKRCGVTTGAGVARKYGLSLGNLLVTAGPDAFVDSLGERLEPERHGDVRIHLFAFGGPTSTAAWARDYLAG
ncbi:methylenetetrahydrofolate reductase [Demequina sp. NBRC 110054]|uniref:methylenetetrahydrofolate reductase n=1 Tax=Demequina sp. NBRC 110054 TaxID=1570343 RepID=UPI001F31FBE6|nr:methylenetetrahydrofolate reductase [Demequina sp. NBRC 110054]